MKTIILIAITCSSCLLYSQKQIFESNQLNKFLTNYQRNINLKEVDDSDIDISESSFGVGLAFGPSWNFKKTYTYYVSPYDTTLRRNQVNSPVFVGSLLFTWNKMATYKRFKPEDKKEATGETFRAPGPLGLAIGCSFAEINPNQMQFNMILSGGMGGLLNLGGGFQIGLFWDLSRHKVLKTDLEENLNKKYPFDNYTDLDSRLFEWQTISSISFKFVYKFKGNIAERSGLLTRNRVK